MFVCDLKAFVAKDGKEHLVLEAVNQIRVVHGEVILRNLFGEEKTIQGSVSEVSLVKSRVVIEQS